MSVGGNMLMQVRAAAGKRLLFLPHAVRQMTRPERMIDTKEIEAVVAKGELVEGYPEDPRGQSCLMLGFGDRGRPVHVVCSPKSAYLAIITAYLPDAAHWTHDFRARV